MGRGELVACRPRRKWTFDNVDLDGRGIVFEFVSPIWCRSKLLHRVVYMDQEGDYHGTKSKTKFEGLSRF